MAYSYQEYSADGLNRNFTVPFEYVKQEEVKVYIDGIETTAFVFPSANVITLDTAPTTGQTVRIGRVTDLEERAVDFVAGAVLSEEDLDTALIQIFNGAQEAVDTANQALRADLDGRADMQNRQVKNVEAPTAPDHAVNLDFIQTEYGNVTAVKANEANINTVAEDIANVNTNATNITDINTVAGSIDNVNNVAANTATLNANMADINTVSDNIADVANLASQIDDIAVVAASFVTSETAPASANLGDRWYQPSSNILYLYGADTANGGNTWFEAAQYQVLREYWFRDIASGRSLFSGSDSEGNTMYIPNGANVEVLVDGLQMVKTTDWSVSGTTGVQMVTNVPAGSYVNIRVHTPMLADEYTWFEARRNETESARDYANTYQTNALSYKNAAETARDTAYQHQVDAQAHRDNALAYKDTALVYRNSAQTYASNASSSANAAAASATEAANYSLSAARQDMEAGSVTTAGLPFVGDPDTGLYKPAANQLGITAGGVNTLKSTSASIIIPSNITLDAPKRNRGLVQMVTWSNSQTKQEVGTGYTDLRYSAVNFTPKYSDSVIIYEFHFQNSYKDAHGIGHYRIYRNGAHQSAWDCTIGGQYVQGRYTLVYRTGSWGTTTQQIKAMFRDYGGSNEVWAHATQHWDGGGGDRNVASMGRVMEWRD